jgi:hypothetical protein
MKKTFTNIPDHQGATIQLYFYQIDDYNAGSDPNNAYIVSFKINNKTIPYNISRSGYDVCGNSSYDSIVKLSLSDSTHNSNSLTFEVYGNRVKFGISNMLLLLSKCANCINNIVTYEL